MAVSGARRRAAIAVLAAALALGGCGRRGKLEPPPDPNNPFALGADPQAKAADGTAGGQTKDGRPHRPKNPPIRPPNESFILDPLL